MYPNIHIHGYGVQQTNAYTLDTINEYIIWGTNIPNTDKQRITVSIIVQPLPISSAIQLHQNFHIVPYNREARYQR